MESLNIEAMRLLMKDECYGYEYKEHSEEWSAEKCSKLDVCPKLSAYQKYC